MSKKKYGQCPLCLREVDLTFHHLIPRKMHRRKRFQKEYSKEQLNQGVDICRPCHRGIHKTYDEMTLATQFNSLTKLQDDEVLQRHFQWVGRQKVSKRKH